MLTVSLTIATWPLILFAHMVEIKLETRVASEAKRRDNLLQKGKRRLTSIALIIITKLKVLISKDFSFVLLVS